MKYRILYTQLSRNGTWELVKVIEAETDESAVAKYQKFKNYAESGRRSLFQRLFRSYIVKGLIRIDQEEITTKIL